MKFDDEVIGHIAQTIQLAILTGTDIIDHLRMVELQEVDGKLFLNEDFKKSADENIEKMLLETDRMMQQTGGDPSAHSIVMDD